MESRLGGIIIVVLVLSAAAVFTIATLTVQEASVVMLQNDFPSRLTRVDTEGKRMTFAHGFRAGRDLAEIEIRFSILHPSPDPFASDNGSSLDSHPDAEIVEDLLGEGWLITDSIVAEVDEELNGTLYFCDLGRSIQPFSDSRSTNYLASAFCRIVDKAGEETYFRGVSDFFYDREDTIEHLVVARQGNETSFTSGPSGSTGLTDAPKGGLVTVTDVRKGEMLVVEFSVVPHPDHLPEKAWDPNYGQKVIQVIRVYADGELVLVQINVLEVDLL
jgi:hypothetical protein